MNNAYAALKTCILIAAMTMLFSLHCKKPQNTWHYSVNPYGLRELYTDVTSDILGTSCVSRLKFILADDKEGGPGEACLSMEFTVSPCSKIKNFNFKRFEGPYAPTAGKELMMIILSRGNNKKIFRVSQSGWLSAEVKDGFTFGNSARANNKNSTLRKIIEGILKGKETIDITVSETYSGAAVSSTFPVGQGRTHFKEFLSEYK